MTENDQANAKSGRFIPVLLISIAIIPVVLTVLVNAYFNSLDSASSKGQLISPPLSIEMLALTSQSVSGDAGWELLLFGNDGCASSQCQKRLAELQQVSRELASRASVMAHYINVGDLIGNVQLGQLRARFGDVLFSQADLEALDEFLDGELKTKQLILGNGVLARAPDGAVMLYYGPQNSPEDMQQDLEKLFEAVN